MKNETLITALVFFVLGSLAGYVFRAEMSASGAVVASDGPEVATGPQSGLTDVKPGGEAEGSSPRTDAVLPLGHPAISDPAVIERLEQQSARNPQDPAAALSLANYLYDHANYEQAIAWYRKTLQLDPQNVDASTDLGTCYFNLGRFDEALQQFRHSLVLDPRHQPTLYNLVVVNMEGKHDYKAARRAWQTLHNLNPNYPNLEKLREKLEQAQN